MTDLTGAELAEATAHVLGFRDDDHRWRHSGTFYIHRQPNVTMPEEWRPDQGGAAAWEVFSFGADRWGFLRFTSLMDSIMTAAVGSMDWAECACRAVVALGEAG